MRFDLNKFLSAAKNPHTASFSFDLSGRDWPGYQLPAPVAGIFSVTRTVEGAEVALQADAAVEAECARCLAPVHESYHIAQQYTVRPRDLEDPDFELPLDEEGLLDVEELVYQEIILAVPRVLLCSPDCLGLCPICGKRKAAGCTCQPAGEAAPAHARLSRLKQLLS